MLNMKTFWGCMLVLGFVVLADALVYEPYSLKITSYNLKSSQLLGLKIIFATDFHMAPYKWEEWRLQKVVDMINAQKPDLVILGGDFVNRHSKNSTMSPTNIAKYIQKISAPKVAVLGNHDTYYGKTEIATALKNVDVYVLNNSSVKLNLLNKDVYILGVKDFDTDKPNIEKALKNTQTPRIFVTHSPDMFVALRDNFDIAFAGHTHAGQIVLPFIGGLVDNTKSHRKYIYGLFYKYQKPLIVSSGLGSSVLPLRFNNLPEIVEVNFY